MDKTYNNNMVGYVEKHTRDMYKLHNPYIKRVIMSREIKWKEWKTTYPAETMKMLFYQNIDDLVPGIEKDKHTTSDTEDKLSVHGIPDEREIARTN